MLLDQVSALGLRTAIDWFEQLSEPDPGLIGIAGSFFGNENYPPPQVYFQFGHSLSPLLCASDKAFSVIASTALTSAPFAINSSTMSFCPVLTAI